MSAVPDASALLAYLQEEPGRAAVAAMLPQAVMSTVNWTEVIGETESAGLSSEDLFDSLEPLSRVQVEIAGRLVERTRPFGLSLADRACLAVAIERRDTAYTADRAWLRLRPDVHVEAIRYLRETGWAAVRPHCAPPGDLSSGTSLVRSRLPLLFPHHRR